MNTLFYSFESAAEQRVTLPDQVRAEARRTEAAFGRRPCRGKDLRIVFCEVFRGGVARHTGEKGLRASPRMAETHERGHNGRRVRSDGLPRVLGIKLYPVHFENACERISEAARPGALFEQADAAQKQAWLEI